MTSYSARGRGQMNCRTFTTATATTTTTTCVLFGRLHLNSGGMEFDDEPYLRRQKRPVADRPTQTSFERLGPKSIPSKPKIVVLGATGKIGRQVIKQLLQLKGVDMTIVAFVRDYDKAIKVLYDDLLIRPGDSISQGNKRGPKLQIVEGNLVPPEELPGYSVDDTEDEQIWKNKAESASKFYGNKVEDYDNREMLPDINEALEEAIRDATTIINCVGSVRQTNIFTDILSRPFVRLLKADVSGWCQDGHHPYYVHYTATRKALGYAETEQRRREAAAITLAEAEGLDLDEIYVPKIRFIRVSDLYVHRNPWNIVVLGTNVFRSCVIRYQEMAERMLQESSVVETVILRPGDLVDDERDVNTTSVQVSATGRVDSPSRIGREDVATLVVASATFATQNRTDEKGKQLRSNEPFHYTFACRWVGQELDPYPAQGRKQEGHPDASVAFRRSLRDVQRKELLEDRKRHHQGFNGISKRPSSSRDIITNMAQKLVWRRHSFQRSKPHGICTAFAIYTFLALTVKTIVMISLPYLPGGNEYLIPTMQRINRWMVTTSTLFLERLVSNLPKLFRRKKVYISF
ncbi:NADPH-binding protein [Nitzschia inconspicua]|uniref:NADPH-binding protein n=1 Tax=Nitzschia inconspicua TaxID=303405 RepID=A0A9K3PXF6_9STRA|nr:NADPH-binding protein [Nitzschia inconspicua]